MLFKIKLSSTLFVKNGNVDFPFFNCSLMYVIAGRAVG